MAVPCEHCGKKTTTSRYKICKSKETYCYREYNAREAAVKGYVNADPRRCRECGRLGGCSCVRFEWPQTPAISVCVYPECGKASSKALFVHLPMCDDHFWVVRLVAQESFARVLTDWRVKSGSPHFGGWTYIVELPNRNVKIGFSNTDDGLPNRLKSLTREHNGQLRVIAVIRGGYTLEQELQYRYRHLRLNLPDEQFRWDRDLLAFAVGSGIDPKMSAAVSRFESEQGRIDMPTAA